MTSCSRPRRTSRRAKARTPAAPRAITSCARWHRDVTFGGAMIVDVIHDIARRAETLDDALRIARERPISSSWGVAIGSARERSAIVLEIAGPTVEVVRPAPSAQFLI